MFSSFEFLKVDVHQFLNFLLTPEVHVGTKPG